MHVGCWLCVMRKNDIVVSSGGSAWPMLPFSYGIFVRTLTMLCVDNGAMCKCCDIESVKCGKQTLNGFYDVVRKIDSMTHALTKNVEKSKRLIVRQSQFLFFFKFQVKEIVMK